MANEVNTLNIGGTSYPIYSEGIKVYSATTGGSFLVASGTGNRKIGVSNAISGNDESLTINSGDIYLGESANSLSLGQYATYIYIGEEVDSIFIGQSATNVILGSAATNVSLGEEATSVYLGTSSPEVYLGNSATTVYLGTSANSVSVGYSARNVKFGARANSVSVGEEATDVILGQGKRTTDENGTVTKHTTTKIGENNNSVYLGTSANSVSLGQEANNVSLGYSAERIQLGDFASELNIGFDASQISIGPNVHQDVDRNTIGINNVGELYITGTHTDVSSPDLESHISMEYDSGSGAMDLNLVSGTTGTINIGGSDWVNQSTCVNINGDNISLLGSATVDISGTNGIQMTGSNFNFIVQPNVSTVDGFNIRHQKNSSIGIVCYAPSVSSPELFMAPRTAYSSSAIVHLGTTSKRFGTLYVTNGYATGGFSTSSDERLKDFGENVEVDLDALASLRKSYYRWNETSGFENEKDRMLGMSAQEVQKIYPEVVATDEDGMLSMAYDRLSVVALAAIDKLHNENKELKDRIANLENLVDTILSRIN